MTRTPTAEAPGKLKSMGHTLTLYAAILFLGAAFCALLGTNTQARVARRRLLADSNPLVAAAGQYWTPAPRWLARPSHRRARTQVEAALKTDAVEWTRYETLRQELFAWNALESAVALALSASATALVVAVISL